MIAVLECRNRWRTIRERYARELRRHGHHSNSTWPYFHLMEFLASYIKPRDISLKLSASKIKSEFNFKRKSDQELNHDTTATSHRLSESDCATGKCVKIRNLTTDI